MGRLAVYCTSLTSAAKRRKKDYCQEDPEWMSGLHKAIAKRRQPFSCGKRLLYTTVGIQDMSQKRFPPGGLKAFLPHRPPLQLLQEQQIETLQIP